MKSLRTSKKRPLYAARTAPLDGRILAIRGRRVILDADLAKLYGVSTKALNQAIKRNGARFPGDFSFLLTDEEKAEVVTNCDHLRAPKEMGFHVREDSIPYRVKRKHSKPSLSL